MKKIDTYKPTEMNGIILNANENPYDFSSTLREEIKQSVDMLAYNRYPDDMAKQLIQAYAAYVNVNENCLLAGNGSDEMLGLLISLFINKGKKLYTFERDFSMYDYYISKNEGTLLKYDWNDDEDFDVDVFIQNGKLQQVDMIMFSNPNNPTGRLVDKRLIIQILEAFPNIPVIVDEAYTEFAKTSMVSYLSMFDNLYLTRTLSKAFGLAAIRCGFVLSNPQNIKYLSDSKVPYNVNSFTQMCASIVLGHVSEIQQVVDTIIADRDVLYEQLISLNLKNIVIFRSYANYLYGKTTQKKQLLKLCEEEKIVIRDFKGDGFRISVGTPEENKQVIDVIKRLENLS